MIRGTDPSQGNAFDWSSKQIDLATQATGELPVTSLPPGVEIAYLRGVQFADGELPAGALDGLNKIFILANAPNPPSSLQLYLGMIQQGGGNDYVLDGKTVTFTTAPQAQPIAWYRF